MKKYDLKNIVFIISFLVALVLPLIFVNKKSNVISSAENRYLASFPNIKDQDTGKINPNLMSDLEVWFNDNIGFRNVFVKLNNKVNYKLFNTMTNTDVMLGKDKWLYLMHEGTIEGIQNKDTISSEAIDYYQGKYTSMTQYFKNRGSDFTITVFPYKTDAYPEYLRDGLLKVGEKSTLEILKEELEGNINFDFHVMYDEIMEAKQDKLIYSKAYDNAHWNNYGGFLGYRTIMKNAQKYLPNLRVLDFDDFNISEFERETYIAGEYFTSEVDYNFELKDERKAVEDKSFFERIQFNSKDPWRSYNYFINEDQTLPKAIVVGDSYVWMFMLENMAESFSELLFVHQLDIEQLGYLHSIVQPDIVLAAGLTGTMLDITNFSGGLQTHEAEIVAHNTPTIIKRDEKYNIEITVKNTSEDIWSEQKQVRLCIWQDGQDFGYRIMIPEGVEVKPGEEITFELKEFEAPQSDSTIVEYQMLEEGVTYFGEREAVNITVE